MKHLKVFSLVLVLALLLAGCSPEGERQTGAPAEENKAKISDAVSREGELTLDGRSLPYAYHVPRIEDDSEDARAINEAIAQQIGGFAEDLAELAENGTDPLCYEIGWEDHWAGNTVSLVIRTVQEAGPDRYVIYHYDFEAGKRLDNGQLLEQLGFTGEDFLLRAENCVMTAYDLANAGLPMDSWYAPDYYSRILHMRSRTLKALANSHDLLIYPSENGCTVLAETYTQSDAEYQELGWHYMPCEVPLKAPAPAPEKTVTDGMITAVLKDNVLTVSYDDTGDLGVYLYGSQATLPIERQDGDREDREVSGLCHEYTDLALCNIGEGYSPWIVLISREGLVDLVNVLPLLQYSASAAIPAYGLFEIQSVRQDEAGTTAYAVGKNTEYDLSQWTGAAFASVPGAMADGNDYSADVVRRTESGSSYEDLYTLRFENDEQHTFRWSYYNPAAGQGEQCDGTYRLLGMNEKGVVYWFMLYREEGIEAGSMNISSAEYEDGSGYYPDAFTVSCGFPGFDLFENGSPTVFQRTFG